MADSFINMVTGGTYDVPKYRFEELLQIEQKYLQYKKEFEKKGEFKILSIVEAQPLQNMLDNKNKEEE